MRFLLGLYVVYMLLAFVFDILGTMAWMLGMTTVSLGYIWVW